MILAKVIKNRMFLKINLSFILLNSHQYLVFKFFKNKSQIVNIILNNF
jgi:hypothetical protein